jgi:hypothetical protein
MDFSWNDGFLMELIRFLLPLATHILFVLNSIAWTYALYLAWIWLVICDELC